MNPLANFDRSTYISYFRGFRMVKTEITYH